jgi:hypothetical protein
MIKPPLRAGKLDAARAALRDALNSLPRRAVKQRAVFLVDLATIELHGGDLDEACRLAGDAADRLHQAGYATGAGRLREFRAEVDRWKTSPAVRMLDEPLAVLGCLLLGGRSQCRSARSGSTPPPTTGASRSPTRPSSTS